LTLREFGINYFSRLKWKFLTGKSLASLTARIVQLIFEILILMFLPVTAKFRTVMIYSNEHIQQMLDCAFFRYFFRFM